MKLLLEPAIQAHRLHGLKIARFGAEGEAIEGVEDALFWAELSGMVGLPRSWVVFGIWGARWLGGQRDRCENQGRAEQ
jgi:hypothetical protein